MGPHYVALDLETTGLNRDSDTIIEIGAVRFGAPAALTASRDGVDATFSRLVNPRRPLAGAVQALTGITDGELREAPPLEAVAAELEAFLGDAIIVGHNAINFDVVFLAKAGIRHANAVYDTQELATILLPSFGQYGLAALAAHFGIDFPEQHRALADAEATRRVFLALYDIARRLPAEALGQIAQWLTPTSWRWRGFFGETWEASLRMVPAPVAPAARSAPSLPRPLSPRTDPLAVPLEQPLGVLASARGRPDLFADFDDRAVQKEMAAAVCATQNAGGRLMVEAGTGTGKSLAYLIPAACQALANEHRVVVSTSTINLQEQLTRKDVPALQALMGNGDLRACQLKGRRNYLCLRRFDALSSAPALSDDEALLASKLLVWLEETQTGDRAELRLSPTEEAVWRRLSAEGADCGPDNSPFVVEGTCFLQRARRQAEGSHIVIVNHSLLLSDTATGGRVLPPYEHLIVDEAHHLEDEASRQFGFTCREKELYELLAECESFPAALEGGLRRAPAALAAVSHLAELARTTRQKASAARGRVQELSAVMKTFMAQHAEATPEQEQRLHINRSMRVQPDWTGIEMGWENLRLALGEAAAALDGLHAGLTAAAEIGMVNQEMLGAQAAGMLVAAQTFLAGLAAAFDEDNPQRVVWVESDRSDGGIVVSWVPLAVDELLQDGLYAGRRSVVLTGATLRTNDSFDYLQERLGLPDAETLALGSPFDYKRAALILLPADMPEPNTADYLEALCGAIAEVARASSGRALVLFTSYAALRAVHAAVSEPLGKEGLTVLGQGIDGSPRQMVRMLAAHPNTVLLGTSSFWEGVDIPGDTLSLLVIARLPFAVPTDPVFAARSALYDDPFSEFALPQAIIRFKQGFGRLIRTKMDRGVLVVLDQRIASKSYGPAFLGSLPACQVRQAPLRQMPDMVQGWLAQRLEAGGRR